jgi:hypothetical protein
VRVLTEAAMQSEDAELREELLALAAYREKLAIVDDEVERVDH